MTGNRSTTDWPPRPHAPSVRLGATYQYQGGARNLKDKQVKVIALTWPGSSFKHDAHLVHVQVVGKNGQLTDQTFGCDPRWLATKGLSPYREYHNRLAAGNKNIKEAKPKSFGLGDLNEQGDLLGETESESFEGEP